MIKKLDIFDFDGTLFRSPEKTEANFSLYEKETGIPWNISKSEAEELSKKLKKKIRPRRGWWGRIETLQPPFVPFPVPPEMWVEEIVQEFHKSKNCKNTTTVMMTGRHAGLASGVLRILSEGGLIETKISGDRHYHNDPHATCLFLGNSGPAVSHPRPMPQETLDWKMWIIEKYLDIMPDLEHLRIFEDRIEHVQSFSELDEIIQPKVEVIYVNSDS